MAKVKARYPAPILRLKKALVRDLETQSGIKAKVDIESVALSRTNRLYRVWVLSPQFKPLWHSERQDLVWRIANRALSPDEQMRVSMILTMTPGELRGRE